MVTRHASHWRNWVGAGCMYAVIPIPDEPLALIVGPVLPIFDRLQFTCPL